MKKIIYLFALLLVFYSCKKQNNCSEPICVYGCMDSTATNYDSLATISDSSCWVVTVDILPNPSDGVFNIEVFAEDVRTLKMSVYNRFSAEIFTSGPEEFTGKYVKEIDLTGNDIGVYILQVYINDDEFIEILTLIE